MKELEPQKVFVQYRGLMRPYEPVKNRKYTITHSDTTAELFVFVADSYAEDQVNEIRDEVRIGWEHNKKGFVLLGTVVVDAAGITGGPTLRNEIFLREMPTALQALRQADRFLFNRIPTLNKSLVFIKSISNIPEYNKIYNFGAIGDYK